MSSAPLRFRHYQSLPALVLTNAVRECSALLTISIVFVDNYYYVENVAQSKNPLDNPIYRMVCELSSDRLPWLLSALDCVDFNGVDPFMSAEFPIRITCGFYSTLNVIINPQAFILSMIFINISIS